MHSIFWFTLLGILLFLQMLATLLASSKYFILMGAIPIGTNNIPRSTPYCSKLIYILAELLFAHEVDYWYVWWRTEVVYMLGLCTHKASFEH